ncbi:hypothetical protein N7491_005898 [Penicillium cf. griseofulvum]|uniref:Uncharacterized protein n=1 Tax=Penicillium cf. griseofulvum TaxID=2972120 RepID=A0A9W9J4L4_9EURO|nr:hypothetical protein N7472_008581 [Penicillium cf. griseofulvum]KAJ5435303.1 hypothetical protein N7491_005898 [Penicillium cf. griseofulvum]KAJ5453136.1 hypothetical protein N7445_001319 [Penicillium cf. griseofulvum]
MGWRLWKDFLWYSGMDDIICKGLGLIFCSISRKPPLVRGLADSRSPFSTLPTITSDLADAPIPYIQRAPGLVIRPDKCGT